MFAIATKPLPKVEEKKLACAANYAFLYASFWGILCITILILKNYVFSVIEFGEGN